MNQPPRPPQVNGAHPFKHSATTQAFPLQQGGQVNQNFTQNVNPNAGLQETIQNYKQQITESNRQIHQLQREKTTLEQQNLQHTNTISQLRSTINGNQNIFEKQLEEKQFQLQQIKSDQVNYKGMKRTLEEQIDEVNRQRQKEQEVHQIEIQTLRERQKTLVEDLQEQRRKYDHLHFYLERNAKQFEFEEEQLKTQIKIKDQELLNLEKQYQKLQQVQVVNNQDTTSNLVAENENLKFKLSEMANKLNNYTDLEGKFNSMAQDRNSMEVQQIEQKLRIEQEKIITKRTIEMENQYNRTTQEVHYLRTREAQLQAENDDYKEKAKKMAETVNETIQQSNMWKEKYQLAINTQSGNQDLNALRSTIQQRETVIRQQENLLKNVTNELTVLKNEQYSNRPSIANNNNNNVEIQVLQNENNKQAEVIQQLQDQLVSEQEETRKRSRNPHGGAAGQQQNVTFVSGNDPELLEKTRKLEIANKALSETVAELEFRMSRLGDTQPAKLGLPQLHSQSQRGSTYAFQSNPAQVGGSIGGSTYPNIINQAPLSYSQIPANGTGSIGGPYSNQVNGTYTAQASVPQYQYTFNVDSGANNYTYQ